MSKDEKPYVPFLQPVPVTKPTRSTVRVSWYPREPFVENFAKYRAYAQWNHYEAACLIVNADPDSIKSSEGPRNDELAKVYWKVFDFLMRVDRSDLKSGKPADIIEWIARFKDILPVPLPEYWSAEQLPNVNPVDVNTLADDDVPLPTLEEGDIRSRAPLSSPLLTETKRGQQVAWIIENAQAQFGVDVVNLRRGEKKKLKDLALSNRRLFPSEHAFDHAWKHSGLKGTAWKDGGLKDTPNP